MIKKMLSRAKGVGKLVKDLGSVVRAPGKYSGMLAKNLVEPAANKYLSKGGADLVKFTAKEIGATIGTLAAVAGVATGVKKHKQISTMGVYGFAPNTFATSIPSRLAGLPVGISQGKYSARGRRMGMDSPVAPIQNLSVNNSMLNHRRRRLLNG